MQYLVSAVKDAILWQRPSYVEVSKRRLMRSERLRMLMNSEFSACESLAPAERRLRPRARPTSSAGS